jgi:ABC-2 type transport system permease protein
VTALLATARQIRYEQLLFWRSREAAIFVFLLPVLLFLLLASVYGDEIDGRDAKTYLLVGMIGYGVANTAFGGLAIFLVLRREAGILKRIRATPLPAPAYLAAVLVSTLLVFALQVAALLAVGVFLFDAEVPDNPAGTLLVLVAGALAFAALGVAAAAVIRSSEGASPMVNVVILPMAFLSGSFGPPEDYPAVLEAIGAVLPLRHFLELLGATYLDGESALRDGGSWAVLAVWALGGLVIAWRFFGWQPRAR